MSNKVISFLIVIGMLLLFVIGVYRHTDTKVIKAQELLQQDSDDQSLANLESPYEIAAYINDHNDEANLNELWEKFRIETDYGKPGRCGCRGYDCPGTCQAQAIAANANEKSGSYVLLRICYAGESDCWFLIFKKESEWNYIGIIESVENQYEPPKHQIIHFQDDLFLTIKELTGRGTGFLDYSEFWYKIGDKPPDLVLSYPVSGHSVQGKDNDYEYKSKSHITDANEHFSVNLEYTVLKDAAAYNPKLRWRFSNKYPVHFIWDSESKRFIYDNSTSRLPESDNDRIFEGLHLWCGN